MRANVIDFLGCNDHWGHLFQLLARLRLLLPRPQHHRLEISHWLPDSLRTAHPAFRSRASRVAQVVDLEGSGRWGNVSLKRSQWSSPRWCNSSIYVEGEAGSLTALSLMFTANSQLSKTLSWRCLKAVSGISLLWTKIDIFTALSWHMSTKSFSRYLESILSHTTQRRFINKRSGWVAWRPELWQLRTAQVWRAFSSAFWIWKLSFDAIEYFAASWIAVFTIEKFGRRQLSVPKPSDPQCLADYD